ncbi:MAG: hypothetical protein OJF50_000574 [Nitrospira sp.]|nr:hypothetical protein [Nitrospira sp.]
MTQNILILPTGAVDMLDWMDSVKAHYRASYYAGYVPVLHAVLPS